MAGGPVSSTYRIGVGSNYQTYLQNADKLYKETLQGYQTALSGLQSQQADINAGYNTLQANVLAGLEGSSKSASQEVADRYTALSGRTTQGLINRGLGNTTVQGAMQRGISLDESKAQTDVQNKFAQTAAGYQTQLGLAGLGYRGQALQQQLGLQGAQLGYMGGYSQQQNQIGLGMAGAYNSSLGRGGGGGGGSVGGGNLALRGGPISYGGGGGGRYYGGGEGSGIGLTGPYAMDYALAMHGNPDLNPYYSSDSDWGNTDWNTLEWDSSI